MQALFHFGIITQTAKVATVKALLIVVIYGTLSGSTAYAVNSGDYGSGSSSDNPDSISTYPAGEGFGYTQSDSQSSVETGSTVIEIQRQYEVAAEAVNLALSYCQSGAGGSSIDGSIVIGDVEFSCKTAIVVPQILSAIPPLLKQAASLPVGSPDRIRIESQAMALLEETYLINGKILPDYIKQEAFYSKIWSFLKVVGFAVMISLAI